MRRLLMTAGVLGFLLSIAPVSVSRTAAAPAAVNRITAAMRRETRKAQRLAELRIPRAGIRRAAPSRATTSTARSGRFTVRPSLRQLREDAQRNAQIERDSFLRPNRPSRTPDGEDTDTPLTVTPERPTTPLRRTTAEAEQAKLELLRLLNEVRAENGLGPLRRNMLLEAAAQAYAEDMKERNFFSHESPEGSTFDQRITAAGYPGPCPQPGCRMRIYLGENLAKGFDTPRAVLDGWMNSPGHRANILNKDFEEVGLGLSGMYWSQSFGKVEISQ